MQPWVAISPVCSAYTGWWPWLVALPSVEAEVADESVAWAVGALSAKVAMVEIQARVGVGAKVAMVEIQAWVGVGAKVAMVEIQAWVGVDRLSALVAI